MIARSPIPRKRSRPRRGRITDKKYIAWCHAEEPCLIFRKYSEGGLISECAGRDTFHHLRFCGSPKNDHYGVTLCAMHHLIQAGNGLSVEAGKKLFEARYGVDLDAEAKAQFARYLVETGRVL